MDLPSLHALCAIVTFVECINKVIRICDLGSFKIFFVCLIPWESRFASNHYFNEGIGLRLKKMLRTYRNKKMKRDTPSISPCFIYYIYIYVHTYIYTKVYKPH